MGVAYRLLSVPIRVRARSAARTAGNGDLGKVRAVLEDDHGVKLAQRGAEARGFVHVLEVFQVVQRARELGNKQQTPRQKNDRAGSSCRRRMQSLEFALSV